MNKLIFLILTMLIISIKSADQASIECVSTGRGVYKCHFSTRSRCCYISDWCNMDKKLHECNISDILLERKLALEHLIKKEQWKYDKKK